jgi:hypothetical protein
MKGLNNSVDQPWVHALQTGFAGVSAIQESWRQGKATDKNWAGTPCAFQPNL